MEYYFLNLQERVFFMGLKKMRIDTSEKIKYAKKDTCEDSKWMQCIYPNYNHIKAEGIMVLRMIDSEFDRRGYDVEKLLKDNIIN